MVKFLMEKLLLYIMYVWYMDKIGWGLLFSLRVFAFATVCNRCSILYAWNGYYRDLCVQCECS